MCVKANINDIIFTGGEPLLYPHLFDAIAYAKKAGKKVTVITNGLLLDDEIIKKLENLQIDRISFSLKGYDEDNYELITKQNSFNLMLEKLTLLSTSKLHVNTSFVMNEKNIDYIPELIKQIRSIIKSNIFLSFEYDNDLSTTVCHSNPVANITSFQQNYEQINIASEGNFKVAQNYSDCLWSDELLSKMRKNKQVTSFCPLNNQSRLIFDSDLSIIPCNAIHFIKLGKLYIDFNNYDELINYWSNNNNITSFYSKVNALPSHSCVECSKSSFCRGGCVVTYFKNKLDDLRKEDAL